MQLVRILLTVTAIVLVGFAPLTADAQTTFTFNGNESVYWHVDGNWNHANWPVAGDTAIIPSGKTCTTGDGNPLGPDEEAAKEVQVAGTLNIVAIHTLTIEDKLDVDGSVRLFTGLSGGATLLYDPGCVFEGTGTVEGSLVSGNSPLIDQTSGPSSLTIQSGVTVKGSMTIKSFHLIQNGLVLVDSTGDTLHLGTSAQAFFTDISGTGTFQVTAGTMAHHKLRLDGSFFSGTLDVDGGTMDFTTDKVQTISAAFVDVSGGTITVEEGSTATFNP